MADQPDVVSERRRRLGAVVLAVLSVGGLAAYVFASTWSAGASVSPEAAVRPPPGPAAGDRPEAPPAADLEASGVTVPEGDYQAFCERLRTEAALGAQDLTVPELLDLLNRLDFPGLIDAAPESIRPSIETVRDGLDSLSAQLAEAGSSGEVDPSELDDDLLAAIGLLGQVGVQECAAGPGG